MDKITENIFLGDFGDAQNLERLKKNKISVILNVAQDV